MAYDTETRAEKNSTEMLLRSLEMNTLKIIFARRDLNILAMNDIVREKCGVTIMLSRWRLR